LPIGIPGKIAVACLAYVMFKLVSHSMTSFITKLVYARHSDHLDIVLSLSSTVESLQRSVTKMRYDVQALQEDNKVLRSDLNLAISHFDYTRYPVPLSFPKKPA